MIWSSFDHDSFNWNNQTYKSILAVETDGILIATQHSIYFDILTHEFDTLFGYTYQERAKSKLLNITITYIKYGISIDQTNHITNKSIQEHFRTKKIEDIKYHKTPFTTDT